MSVGPRSLATSFPSCFGIACKIRQCKAVLQFLHGKSETSLLRINSARGEILLLNLTRTNHFFRCEESVNGTRLLLALAINSSHGLSNEMGPTRLTPWDSDNIHGSGVSSDRGSSVIQLPRSDDSEKVFIRSSEAALKQAYSFQSHQHF
jgi:hypothetical protein